MGEQGSTKQRILLVEDDIHLLKLFSTALTVQGYKVFEAQNGLDGLNILKSNDIDMVITDWRMPRMNGMRLLQSIRESELLSNIPVLLLSASEMPEIVNKAYSLGVNGWLKKPFKFNKLLKAVDGIVNTV